MGVLLLVGVIVVGVFAAGVPTAIAGGVHRAICTIASGTDCGDPNRERRLRRRSLCRHRPRGPRDLRRRLPGRHPGRPGARGRRRAVGDDQVDKAYENLGRVYDYYHDTFGYDSYDGKGSPVVGIVNNCAGGNPTGTSYWSDNGVHFAPGAGDALDTAAHEFTHGVTANTAGLKYECQSGALNESISDIMAWNLDPEDPTYGEDRDGGAIRDYEYPEHFGQPMTVDDYEATKNDRFGDWGGVHTNSGIPNHAYWEVVVQVGRDKAEQIVWRALTEHLEPGLELRGLPDRDARLGRRALRRRRRRGQDGVDAAFAAVGLDGSWEAPEQEGC